MASKALTYFKVLADCIVGQPVAERGIQRGLRCLRFNFGFYSTLSDMACYKYLQHFDKVAAATVFACVSVAVSVSLNVSVVVSLSVSLSLLSLFIGASAHKMKFLIAGDALQNSLNRLFFLLLSGNLQQNPAGGGEGGVGLQLLPRQTLTSLNAALYGHRIGFKFSKGIFVFQVKTAADFE